LSYSHEPGNRQSGSFSESLSLTSKLRPDLSADLSQSYSRATASGSTAHNINGSLRWRTSDALQLGSNFSTSWATDEDVDYNITLQMSAAPNYKNRISLAYSFAKQDSRQSLGGSWTWTINRIFNFRANGSYATNQSSGDSWSVAATLNFATSL
jgi:hypothetical protein